MYGIFSVQQPWEQGVDLEIKEGKTIAEIAKKLNVKHFVYSSVGGADKNTGIPFFDSKWRIEEHIRKLGLNFTIIRPVYFMENFLAHYTYEAICNGKLSLAIRPEVPLQLIAVDDIGAFAAYAFDNPDQFIGKAIEIAGDELTCPQIAEAFSRAIGRHVVYEEMPLEKVRESSSDYAMMFDWLNLKGFTADIPTLRKILPDMETIESWMGKSGFLRKAA